MLLEFLRRAVVQLNPEKENTLKQYNTLKNRQKKNNNKQTQNKPKTEDVPGCPPNLGQLVGEQMVIV